MLREMSSSLISEWQVYDELDPFGEERDDYRFASIPLGVRREIKGGTMRLLDFMVPFGDSVVAQSRVQQSVEYQERVIEAWITGSNAIFAAKRQS